MGLPHHDAETAWHRTDRAAAGCNPILNQVIALLAKDSRSVEFPEVVAVMPHHP